MSVFAHWKKVTKNGISQGVRTPRTGVAKQKLTTYWPTRRVVLTFASRSFERNITAKKCAKTAEKARFARSGWQIHAFCQPQPNLESFNSERVRITMKRKFDLSASFPSGVGKLVRRQNNRFWSGWPKLTCKQNDVFTFFLLKAHGTNKKIFFPRHIFENMNYMSVETSNILLTWEKLSDLHLWFC